MSGGGVVEAFVLQVQGLVGDVSFIDERGAHAGPSEAELQTFIILHPPSVRVPATPLTHPVQLYPHFMSYRAAEARRARVGALSTLLTE